MSQGKRKISQAKIDSAEHLAVTIPDFPGSSHPFSSGLQTEIYRPEGLKKVATAHTNRTDWFLKVFCTVFVANDHQPVPFFFYTDDGDFRSLDAGCVGYLINCTPPRLRYHLGENDFIVAVSPTDTAFELSRPMIDRLLPEVSGKRK